VVELGSYTQAKAVVLGCCRSLLLPPSPHCCHHHTDGMGCWSIGSDTTVVGLITNATFANFAKLCQGGYGSRPLQAGHTLVAVNPDWTRPEDIGQFWDR
jgi:hypothetical protein